MCRMAAFAPGKERNFQILLRGFAVSSIAADLMIQSRLGDIDL